jgi:hypothetical protein
MAVKNSRNANYYKKIGLGMFDVKKAGLIEIIKKVKRFQVKNNGAFGAVFISEENQLHS